MNEEEINKLSEYCDRVLDLKKARLSDEYFYQSLPLCIIDAVFSIGVNYEGTRRTVIRYCDYFKLQRIREVKGIMPSIETQESVGSFLEKMLFLGLNKFCKEVFINAQRTSTKSGILKTEAVFRFANTLKDYGVNYFQDVTNVINDAIFENDIQSIPGQKSGISLKYFFMLSGSENLIKPDRHILAFIKRGLRKKIGIQCAQVLLTGSYEILKSIYPHLTPRLLDHMIWRYQRGDAKHIDDKKINVSHVEGNKSEDEKPTYITKVEQKKHDWEYIRIGPYRKTEIVLCSADAGPGSQSKTPYQAGYFFPGGKWVGTVRNAAERLMCRFVILTTGHGMVNPDDIIKPYDMHIDEYEEQVREKMNATIPQLIGNARYKIVIFYSGGVPKEPYIKVLIPIFHNLKLDLLTFGRPSMFDSGKIDEIVKLLTKPEGTTTNEIKMILKLPERLEFYSMRQEFC